MRTLFGVSLALYVLKLSADQGFHWYTIANDVIGYLIYSLSIPLQIASRDFFRKLFEIIVLYVHVFNILYLISAGFY